MKEETQRGGGRRYHYPPRNLESSLNRARSSMRFFPRYWGPRGRVPTENVRKVESVSERKHIKDGALLKEEKIEGCGVDGMRDGEGE